MNRVVVVGASGYLGRHVVAELADRGVAVTAVVRDRTRAEKPTELAPGLIGVVDRWVVGDVSVKGWSVPEDVWDGAAVVSCLGVTTQGTDPWTVDYSANLRVLKQAEGAGAEHFTYVNVMNADEVPSLLTRAKSAFAECLRRSVLTAQVVNPTGFFSDLTQVYHLARRGVSVQVGSGMHRLNPIHGSDLAGFVAERVALAERGEWDVGGPNILTHREINELAARAAGRKTRTITVPSWGMAAGVWATRHIAPMVGETATFFAHGLCHDVIGEPIGTHTLADYYAALAAQETTR